MLGCAGTLRAVHPILSRRVWLLAWLLAVTSSSAACRRGGSNSRDASTITIGIQQEPDSLFLPFREMIAAEEMVRAASPSLAVFDDRWELVPHAATQIPTTANGRLSTLPDGRMKATWTLRPDLVWPDGTAVTARDVRAWFNIMKDPRQEIADRTVVDLMESLELDAKDPSTFHVMFKQRYAYHANYRAFELLPAHLVEPAHAAAGGALKSHAFGSSPIFPGAFTFGAWERGQYVVFVRNPKAVGPNIRPAVDKLIWKIIPTTAALEAHLLSGDIDAVSPVGLLLDQALLLKQRVGEQGFTFHLTDGLQWEHVDFNLDHPWFKDVRMRQALTHALDRQAMVDTLFAGKQPVAHGYSPPRRYDHAPDVRRYAHDPARAAALLEELGWKVGPDGIRARDGERLTITLTTTAGVSTRERVTQIMMDQYKKVGVELVVDAVPAKVLFGELTRRRKFKHLVMFAWLFDPLKGPDSFWRCDQIPGATNGWQGQNYGGWCQQKASSLIEQAGLELDDVKRAALLRDAERLWADGLPAIPLYFRAEVSITRKGFDGWRPTGTLTPVTWNAQSWKMNP